MPMSRSLDRLLADISLLKRRIQEALPTWDSPASEVERFSARAKLAARGKRKIDLSEPKGGEAPQDPRPAKLAPYGGKRHQKSDEQRLARRRKGQIASFRSDLGVRIADLLRKKGIDPASATPRQISKRIKTAGGSVAKPDKDPAAKGTPEHIRRIERKSFAVQSKKGRAKAGHGGGAAGKGGASQKPYGGAYGTPSAVHDPDDQEEQVGNYVAKTILAGGLTESVLMERRSKAQRKERKEYQQAQRSINQRERGSHEKAQRKAGKSERKDLKTRRQRFKDKRSAGALKGHKEKEKDGKSKYENPTTFKKCSPGAMISTPYLRQQIPQNRFVKPDDDNPTWPIRSNCRASLAGVGRALQFSNPGSAKVRQVLARVNRLGGVRGKARIKLWGTGVGGSRMETHRGPSGAAKRNKSYGTPTGERDDRLHTASDEHGKAGNREVPRATGHAAKQPVGKKSERKKKREEAGRKVTIKRGQKKLGREQRGPIKISKAPEHERGGSALLSRWQGKSHKSKKRKSKR